MDLRMSIIWWMLLLWEATMAETAYGCQEKCGKIKVPLPFGIENSENSDCSKDSKFLLTCNNESESSPKLMYGNIQLLNISVEQGTAIGYTPIASSCYNDSFNDIDFNLTGSPFTFSPTQNMLIAIIGLNSAHSDCTADRKDCNPTQVPTSLKTFHTGKPAVIRNFGPCSYAFLADREWRGISNMTFSDTTKVRRYSQVVLDWVVSDLTCESALNSSSYDRSYACGNNTKCTNYDSGTGYRCICKPGYHGNPYLPHGCQDINECLDPKTYPCHGSCKNMPGNYTCSCPLVMHGDGKVGCHGFHLLTLVAGASVSLVLLLVVASLYWLYQGRKKRKIIKRKRRFFKRNGGFLLEQQISPDKCNIEKIKIFTAEELEKATDHYNENRIIGQGGQGTVYKGMLPDGRIIAVKKSNIVDKGQTEQFINEIAILSQINHRNVLKLLGCCLETEVPLLVYEFVSNGTLSCHIHDHNIADEFPLTWTDRLRIATEVAGALAYLHFAASIPIFHRDIKSSNILLDNKYEAKVSDFGISRSVPIEKTHLTTLVRGTLGYLDPEYFRSNQFTEKSDVYSFGVVLVELLTGRKPISSTRMEDERGLAVEFISAIKEKCLFDILDPQVAAEGENEVLIAVADLAKRCVKLNGKKRPTMKEVALELENLRKLREHLLVNKNNEAFECFITIPSDSEVCDTSLTSFELKPTSSWASDPEFMHTVSLRNCFSDSAMHQNMIGKERNFQSICDF